MRSIVQSCEHKLYRHEKPNWTHSSRWKIVGGSMCMIVYVMCVCACVCVGVCVWVSLHVCKFKAGHKTQTTNWIIPKLEGMRELVPQMRKVNDQALLQAPDTTWSPEFYQKNHSSSNIFQRSWSLGWHMVAPDGRTIHNLQRLSSKRNELGRRTCGAASTGVGCRTSTIRKQSSNPDSCITDQR